MQTTRSWFLNHSALCILAWCLTATQSPTARSEETPKSTAAPEAARKRMALDGSWDFELDEQGQDSQQRTFLTKKEYASTITVPGAWQTQGFGKPGGTIRLMPDLTYPADHLRHNSEGVGWYRKTLEIPTDWKDGLVWLTVGLGIRYTDLYVNGQLAGTHEGFSTPFQFEISRHLSFGKPNTIILAVDNRPRKGKSFVGCLNYTGNWGGIGRSVVLETTPRVHISDVFVQPRLKDNFARLLVTVRNERPEPALLKIAATVSPAADMTAVAGQATAELTLAATESKTLELNVPVRDVQPWSPENPFLYAARVTAGTDERTIRFGMREIAIDGNKILLNGVPVFLRGYGDDNIEMLTGLPPTDKNVYRDRLKLMKSYGFNFVRHHSWVPYEEYLDAADEVGMLLQPEAPNIYANVFSANADECFKEWERIILAFRNHPSILTWCAGNEHYYGPLWYEKAKQLDPSRPVNHADAHGPAAPYAFPTDIHTDVSSIKALQPSPEDLQRRKLYPTISHEHGTYCASLPDTSQIKAYTGIVEPVTLTRCQATVDRLGLTDQYPRVVHNSFLLLNTIRKVCIENARATGLQGYNYWLGTDFAEGAEGSWNYGVMTWDWKPKALNREEFNEYNGPSVPLIDLSDNQRTLFDGEPIAIGLSLSHYGPRPLQDATVTWWYETGAEPSAKIEFTAPPCPCGEATRLGEIQFTPRLNKAARIVLRVEVRDAGGKICSNRWPLWIFPRNLLSEPTGTIAYEEGDFRFRPRYPFLTTIEPGLTESQKAAKLHDSRLLVTYYLGDAELEYLDQGGRVLLLSRQALKGQGPSDFWINTWGMGFGTVIEHHPVFSNFPQEGYCDLNFYGLLREGSWVPIQMLPRGVKPILWSVATSGVEKKDVYALAAIWEAGVGKGKLLVSTHNFVFTYPESVFLTDELLRYCLSDAFDPPAKITRAELEPVIVKPTVRGFH